MENENTFNHNVFNAACENQLRYLDAFSNDAIAFYKSEVANKTVRSILVISELPEYIISYADYCIELQKAKTLAKLWEGTEKQAIIEKHIEILEYVIEYYAILLDLE
jgi:hypothetical protein